MSRRWTWALAALLAVSFALRVWYGSADPTSLRFYDERYSFHNVTALWLHDRGEPANAYYPSLSFLPQTALLWASETASRWTGLEILSVRGGPGQPWSPTAYLLCRGLSALYGTLSIYWLFRIGRRLFGPAVGWTAALLLSVVPHHLFSSAMFKPDILVVWLVLVAFEWSLDAVERVDLRRFGVAGVGVGLAVAAKYTGVGAAIPLTVGALAGRRRSRRTWGLLILAGLASIVTFLVLNPWIGATLGYLPELAEIYETKGEEAGGSHGGVLLAELGFLWRHHGPAVFPFLLLGAATLVPRAKAHRGVLMTFAWVVGYSALYAAATTLFKGQNYLPVVPFTALWAGWGVVWSVRRAVERMPVLRQPALGLLMGLLGLGILFVPAVGRIYGEVVPTQADRAAGWLAGRLPDLDERHVVYETWSEDGFWVRAGGSRAASRPVERLPDVDEKELDRADVEVFPVSRLEGEDADVYLRRLARGGTVRRFEAEAFRGRGTELLVLLHPWRKVREDPLAVAPGDGPGRYRLAFPPAGGSRVASLVLDLPMPPRGAPPPILRLGDREVSLRLTQGRGRRGTYVTERFEVASSVGRIPATFENLPRGPGEPAGRLVTWQPPDSALDSPR